MGPEVRLLAQRRGVAGRATVQLDPQLANDNWGWKL